MNRFLFQHMNGTLIHIVYSIDQDKKKTRECLDAATKTLFTSINTFQGIPPTIKRVNYKTLVFFDRIQSYFQTTIHPNDGWVDGDSPALI